jgi:hypothetical protein
MDNLLLKVAVWQKDMKHAYIQYSFCVKKALNTFFQSLKNLKIEFPKTEDRTERKIKASVSKEQSDKVGWYCTVHD